jgi:hypothetical protein
MTALLVEREALHEEIRQLNAAVHIYAEVVRQLESVGSPRKRRQTPHDG